jgi:hypothetical protein
MGRRSYLVRWPLATLVVVLAAGWCWLHPGGSDSRFTLIVLAAAPLVHAAVAPYRRLCRRRLRHSLARLAPDEQRRVLQPLKEDLWADTTSLARSLLREVPIRLTEISPADLPTGSGREPSPAEGAALDGGPAVTQPEERRRRTGSEPRRRRRAAPGRRREGAIRMRPCAWSERFRFVSRW